MMLLQAQEFKLFEEQKAMLYQCIMESELSADTRIFRYNDFATSLALSFFWIS